MITSQINKLLSLRSEIKILYNSIKSLQSRYRVVIKSSLSRLKDGGFISFYIEQGNNQNINQFRAPPPKHLTPLKNTIIKVVQKHLP